MQETMNKTKIASEIRKLGVLQRLDILADMWDEMKESKELEAVSTEEKIILLNRLSNYRENPGSAEDWEKLKREVLDKYDKKS